MTMSSLFKLTAWIGLITVLAGIPTRLEAQRLRVIDATTQRGSRWYRSIHRTTLSAASPTSMVSSN